MLQMLRSLCLLLVLVSFSQLALGQTTYSTSQINYAPDPFTVGTPLGVTVDDIYSSPISLPFGFCFYDSTFTEIVIGSNGIISFDTTKANGFCAWTITDSIPTASIDDYTIMAPYQDIDPSVGGTIRTAIAGVAPYRRFVVSFFQVPMFSCNTLQFSEQIILYETTNIIEVHIQDKPLCTTWNGGVAILGIQKDSSNALAAPGRNFPTQWVATNESWAFTPQGPCAGPLPESTLLGKVYADFNNNCVYDPGTDAPIANRSIHVNGGVYYAWTDNQGDYIVPLDTGNWVVGEVLGPYYAYGCPASGTHNVNFTAFGQTYVADFADSVTVICPDLMVDIGAINMTACFQEIVAVRYCNLGTVTDSNAVVTVTLNDSITINTSTLAYTTLPGNVYQFNVGNLNPGQCGNIYLNVNIGCDSLGTIYCMDASIQGQSTSDCDTTNNAAQDCHALVGSFDPNDKMVQAQIPSQGGWLNDEDISENDGLTYRIRFQNTGTDTARTVIIRDTLSSFLDAATLVAGAASHPYNWTVINGVLLVDFGDIALPDSSTNLQASQGFIKFRIKQNPGNGPGDLIENSAAIFFDFNPPIITNTTTNLIVAPLAVERPGLQKAQVYPNPGHDRLSVDWQGMTGDEFVLRNLIGQEVRRVPLRSAHELVPVVELQPGAYLYSIERNGKLLAAGKWLKQ